MAVVFLLVVEVEELSFVLVAVLLVVEVEEVPPVALAVLLLLLRWLVCQERQQVVQHC